MAKPVRLQDVVDAFEMPEEIYASFLDLDTGSVLTVSQEVLEMAEESDEEERDQYGGHPEWETAERIATGERILPLPSKFDIHEWSIMEDFVQQLDAEPRIVRDLQGAIHGGGAFRRFKDAIHRHGIQNDWYAFRTAALTEIAREWCESHGLLSE